MKVLTLSLTFFLLVGCASYKNRGICDLDAKSEQILTKNVYDFTQQSGSECKDFIAKRYGRLNNRTCYVLVRAGGEGQECPIIIHGDYYVLFREKSLTPIKKLHYMQNGDLRF